MYIHKVEGLPPMLNRKVELGSKQAEITPASS